MVCITPGDLQEREAVQGSKGRPPLGGVWGKEAWEASRDHLFPFPGVGWGRRGLLNRPAYHRTMLPNLTGRVYITESRIVTLPIDPTPERSLPWFSAVNVVCSYQQGIQSARVAARLQTPTWLWKNLKQTAQRLLPTQSIRKIRLSLMRRVQPHHSSLSFWARMEIHMLLMHKWLTRLRL